jgi:flagellar export protein FliJ
VKPAVLEKLIEMADRKRELAAGRRARAEQARAKASGTLQSLEQYRQSHRDNRRAAIGLLPGASGLAVHARFGGKLDEAIEAQREQCRSLELSVDARSDELRKAHARLQALRALEQRRERARRRREDAAEQRTQDDLVSGRHSLGRAGR